MLDPDVLRRVAAGGGLGELDDAVRRILVDLGRSSLDPEAFFADNARAQAALAGLGSLCASAGPRVLGVASVAELLLSATAHPGAREAVAAGAPSLAGALVAGITSACAIGQAPAPAALLLLARLLYPGFGGYLSPASRNGLGAEQLCRLAEGLVQLIQSPHGDAVVVQALGLFACLCRLRPGSTLRRHIKSLPHIKRFYKALIAFLSHPDLDAIVFALCVLVNLLLNDELGQTFFNPQNVHQTFELAFNLVEQCFSKGQSRPDHSWMYNHCVDLFVDLLQSKEVYRPLLQFQRLPACLGVLVRALGDDSGNTATSKTFELLAAFCQVAVAPSAAPAARLEAQPRSLRTMLAECAVENGMVETIILYGFVPGIDLGFQANHRKLAGELCAEASQLGDDRLQAQLIAIATTTYDMLKGMRIAPAVLAPLLAAGLSRKVSLLELLCSSNPAVRDALGTRQSVAQDLLAVVSAAAAGTVDDHGSAFVEFFVASVNLLRTLGAGFGLAAVLASGSASVYVSQALVSDDHASVLNALKVVQYCNLPRVAVEAARLRSNTAVTAVAVALRARAPDLPSSSPAVSPVRVPKLDQPQCQQQQSQSPLPDGTLDGNNHLISRLMRGLQIKDMKSSELLAIYESKFREISAKENKLLGLLDAKNAALTQSDGLLDEYRAKQQAMNKQFESLSSLLQDAERRAEAATTATASSKTETAAAREECARMQRTVGELQTAVAGLVEDKARHTELQTEHAELVQLDSHLKHELEETNETIARLEQELEHLSQRDQETTALCVELKASVEEVSGVAERRHALAHELQAELEATCAKLDYACDETEVANQALRDSAAKTDRLQSSVAALQAKVSATEQELAKHQRLAEMIHNLSSSAPGPNPPSVSTLSGALPHR